MFGITEQIIEEDSMKKLSLVTVLLLASAMLFAGGGSQSSSEGSVVQPAAKPLELVWNAVAIPTDTQTMAMYVAKDTIERVSGGQIKVTCYDSGSLFKQEQSIAAVKTGQADIVLDMSASWLTDGSPWVSMFTAGYIFQNNEHMNKVLNGDIGKQAYERITNEQGIRPLAAWYIGARQINLVADKPVKTPADLRGVNLRMPNSEAWVFLGKALGANPTPIALGELYMALQTRTVDGQDNPLPMVRGNKFYEVTKSISITNHLIDAVWPTVNEKKWQSLTAQQKEWVMAGIDAGTKFCNETNLKAEGELVDFFKSQGLSVYNADVKAFADHVLDEYLKSSYAKTWDMDLFKKVQDMAN
jgi:tripartite ATP-independent transporter DctP family solute receptor